MVLSVVLKEFIANSSRSKSSDTADAIALMLQRYMF